jgi:hypothetical protein
MSGKFFCKRPGGWKVRDAGGEILVNLLEGTREKGPWYQAFQFSDEQIERWLAKGIIEMVD